MDNTTIDELPFDTYEFGRIGVDSHNGRVYVVTHEGAYGVEPHYADELANRLMKHASLAQYQQDSTGGETDGDS